MMNGYGTLKGDYYLGFRIYSTQSMQQRMENEELNRSRMK